MAHRTQAVQYLWLQLIMAKGYKSDIWRKSGAQNLGLEDSKQKALQLPEHITFWHPHAAAYVWSTADPWPHPVTKVKALLRLRYPMSLNPSSGCLQSPGPGKTEHNWAFPTPPSGSPGHNLSDIININSQENTMSHLISINGPKGPSWIE